MLLWFGNFTEFTKFSLYADDWSYLGSEFRTSWTAMGWFNGISLYASGRPIQWSLIYLTGVIIDLFNSLNGGYILVFLITAASLIAMWRALIYRFSNTTALVATAVFSMSPLVSIRPFLNGIAAPAAFFFLMIAGIIYVSNRKILAYFVSALVLLSYELVFPLFVLLPTLLKPLRTRGDFYRLIGHAVICVLMIAAEAFSLRYYHGSRLQDVMADKSAIDIGVGIISAAVQSFPYGLVGSVDVPLWFEKIRTMADVEAWAIFAFCGSIFLLYRASTESVEVRQGDRWLLAQTLIVLLLMVLAGYVLTYFVSTDGATAVLGRQSRFHSAASLPFSILTGIILVGLLRFAKHRWLRLVMVIMGAGYLALMFAFSVSHQTEFERATERQRLVVAQLIIDHPLMDPDATFVIRFPDIDDRHLPAIEYEDYHSWYQLLQHLIDFPRTERRAGPVIRIVHSDTWPKQLALQPNGELDWLYGAWPSLPEQAGHIWYYELAPDGALRPLKTPIMVGGRNILHEGTAIADGAIDLRRASKSPLFALLMGPDAALVDAELRPVLD
jgi:hypothetical protein